jgi:hypothetical protein
MSNPLVQAGFEANLLQKGRCMNKPTALQEAINKELRTLAFADRNDFYTDGQCKQPFEIPEQNWAIVKGVATVNGLVTEYKFVSLAKQRWALKKLAKIITISEQELLQHEARLEISKQPRARKGSTTSGRKRQSKAS